jgi:hypothetical protein
LQSGYAAQPFSPAQKQAYWNQFNNTSGFRDLSQSLMGQMSKGEQFDRSNPLARPMPFNFGSLGGNAATGPASQSLNDVSAFYTPYATQQGAPAQAMTNQQGNVYDGNWGGGAQGGNGPGGMMGGASAFTGGIHGMMNGPFGIGAGFIANAIDKALGIKNMAPVVDGQFSAPSAGGYGTSATMNGAPNAAQAQAIADSFARDFGGYANGGFGGGDGYGNASGSMADANGGNGFGEGQY